MKYIITEYDPHRLIATVKVANTGTRLFNAQMIPISIENIESQADFVFAQHFI